MNPILESGSRVGEKRSYQSDTSDKHDVHHDEKQQSRKKLKIVESDGIHYVSKIINNMMSFTPSEQEDYWNDPEILKSIWCRYCLSHQKSNHDEETCDYNLKNRTRGKRCYLCNQCGQTQSLGHKAGTDKCNRKRNIILKLYEKWPHSVLKLGFDPETSTFINMYSTKKY